MVSAASRAAKTLGGSSRNRPSRSMSSGGTSGLRSSTNTSDSGDYNSGNSGGPQFMDDVQAQYESLSERLARENNNTMSGNSAASGGSKKPSRKVRWAETAAIASTMDGQNAAASDDPDYTPRSPMDIVSDLFTKKYTLPIFLGGTALIFLMVHLAGGPNEDSLARYGSPSRARGGPLGEEAGRDKFGNRQKNVGGGDGFGDIIFSLTPSTELQSSHIPTIEVIHHNTPKISPAAAGSPSLIVGNEPGWIVVPTSTGVLLSSDADKTKDGGSPTTLKWNYGAGVPTPDPALLGSDQGSPTTLKWNFGAGVPTPDPAFLDKDKGSPTTLKWNFGGGVPTPDPAFLDKDKGSPTTLVWNYPPGVPTPNPALLVEVAPPHDEGSPTTLKWGNLQTQPRDPAKAAKAAPAPAPGPIDPDKGSPTTLKWNFPPGIPTPDPVLLTQAVPDTISWGYPPGVPTPDPVLLSGGYDSAQISLSWGYPPGVPTPDPVLLTESAVIEPVGWGYPENEPTPDPALLNGVVGITPAPTKRNVETGIRPKPTPLPTKQPSPAEPEKTNSPFQTLKVVDISPPTPKRQPKAGPDPTNPPIVPPPLLDWMGNEVVPPPGREPRPPRPAPRPKNAPKVDTKPYQGPGGYGQGQGQGQYDPFYNGPNGITLPGEPRPIEPSLPQPLPQPQPGYPYPYPNIYQGVGGVVIPQQSSCGCCCCQCGGGGMTGYNFALPQGVMPQMTQGGGQLPLFTGGIAPLTTDANGNIMQVLSGEMATAASTHGCPWDCVIDENVPSHGRSNEDDALYEIFYTNPLNCCGTIVEIGAGDGIEHSASYFFEKGMNWTTVLTEADPTEYAQIEGHRNGTKVKAINGAFCKEGPHLLFDKTTSTFQSPATDDYSSELMGSFDASSTSTSKVNCIRLDKILAGISHINVMVVRVKGDPWAVIRTMDWDITVDVWVILMETREGMLHDTIKAALKLNDYVPAAWDIKLWCDSPENCFENKVWLRKNFNPTTNKPLLDARSLRGSFPAFG